MKNKSLLLIGFASLVIITASSFQLSNFEKSKIVKNSKTLNANTSKTGLATALSEKLGTKKLVVASLIKHGIVIQNSGIVKTKASKPDILFFIADDMTSIDCEPYGNKDVYTPNLAKLAKEGMTFDNMNNATAMCGPTRQSLYTGLFPVKNGSYPNHAQVYDNVISIVQHFKKIGYRVALIGKQHYAPMANFPFEYLGGRNSDNGKDQM